MGSNSALYIATSALNAQSANLSIIATNLANVETTAYKESSAYFQTLISDPYSASASSTSGVTVSRLNFVSLQGLIESTESSTDMAIDGDGFFVVTSSPDSNIYYYTRAGSFGADDDGYLVNANGFYLQGWAVDSDGNYLNGSGGSVSSLETINLNAVSGSAKATSEISIVANLPANASTSDSFTTSSEIFDSLGVSHTIDYTWQKTAENTWTLSVSNPTQTSGDGSDSGTAVLSDGSGTTYSEVTITFNDDGTLASTSPTNISIDISGWTTGAGDDSITVDLGTTGGIDGLSQFASDDADDPEVSVKSVTQNGLQYGEFVGAYVDESGLVIAVFDNGQSRSIYQLPLATFNNPNGLQELSGNVYQATAESGDYTLNIPGYGGSGTVSGYSLESSTVTTTEELVDMITAQQAYSSASQVITADEEMFDELMRATR